MNGFVYIVGASFYDLSADVYGAVLRRYLRAAAAAKLKKR